MENANQEQADSRLAAGLASLDSARHKFQQLQQLQEQLRAEIEISTHTRSGQEVAQLEAASAQQQLTLRWAMRAVMPVSLRYINSLLACHIHIVSTLLDASKHPPSTPFPLLDLPTAPLATIATLMGPAPARLACKALHATTPLRHLTFSPPNNIASDPPLLSALLPPSLLRNLTSLNLSKVNRRSSREQPATTATADAILALAATHCPHLHTLTFHQCSPTTIALLPPFASTLHTLNLGSTFHPYHIVAQTPQVLAPLRHLTALRSLTLPPLPPNNTILPHILPLPHLTHLNIQHAWMWRSRPAIPDDCALPLLAASLPTLASVNLTPIHGWDTPLLSRLTRLSALTSLKACCFPNGPPVTRDAVFFRSLAALPHLADLTLHLSQSAFAHLPALVLPHSLAPPSSPEAPLNDATDPAAATRANIASHPDPASAAPAAIAAPNGITAAAAEPAAAAHPLKALQLTLCADDPDENPDGGPADLHQPDRHPGDMQPLIRTLKGAPHLTHLALDADDTRDGMEEVWNPYYEALASDGSFAQLLAATPTTLRSLSLTNLELPPSCFPLLATLPHLTGLHCFACTASAAARMSHLSLLTNLRSLSGDVFGGDDSDDEDGGLQPVGQLTSLTRLEMFYVAQPVEAVWELLPLQQLEYLEVQPGVEGWHLDNPHLCAVLAHLPQLRRCRVVDNLCELGLVWRTEDVRRKMAQLVRQHEEQAQGQADVPAESRT